MEKERLLEEAAAARGEVQQLADDLAAAKADLAGQLEAANTARASYVFTCRNTAQVACVPPSHADVSGALE